MLVEGDDFNEPVADAVRSILDGHIVLTRELADQGHYPSIDVLKSVSRLSGDITSKETRAHAQRLIRMLATFNRVEDMINIGAYVPGSNPEIDLALEMNQPIRSFLQQSIDERCTLEQSFSLLDRLAGKATPAQPGS